MSQKPKKTVASFLSNENCILPARNLNELAIELSDRYHGSIAEFTKILRELPAGELFEVKENGAVEGYCGQKAYEKHHGSFKQVMPRNRRQRHALAARA